eukprot:jgi/Botrbrau1/21484/Bobra.0435s0001.1
MGERGLEQNSLGLPPMLLVSMLTGELTLVFNNSWSFKCWSAVFMTCVAGLGMGYMSFALRAAISATSFSVIGNVCKMHMGQPHYLFWPFHGQLLQQSPMRREHRQSHQGGGRLVPSCLRMTLS